MGVRFPSVSSNVLVSGVLVTTAETVICTTPQLTLPLDFAQVIILFFCALTTGVGTTNINWKIRRGTTVAGAVVAGPGVNLTAAAGTNPYVSGVAVDVPGAVAGQQYSLTLTQFAATGNGAVDDAVMLAFAL